MQGSEMISLSTITDGNVRFSGVMDTSLKSHFPSLNDDLPLASPEKPMILGPSHGRPLGLQSRPCPTTTSDEALPTK